MNKLEKLRSLGAVLGIVAIGIIWYESNWLMALGVFLALFANNLEQTARLKTFITDMLQPLFSSAE